MYNRLKAIIAHHPRHQHALLLCLNQSGEPKTIARLVGEKCRELRITDFRNPWSGFDDKLAKVWNDNFGLQSQESENKARVDARADDEAKAAEAKKAIEADEAKAAKAAAKSQDETVSFDYKAATKEQIEQHCLDITGVNLNTRDKKADLTKKAKAEIKKFEKANQPAEAA